MSDENNPAEATPAPATTDTTPVETAVQPAIEGAATSDTAPVDVTPPAASEGDAEKEDPSKLLAELEAQRERLLETIKKEDTKGRRASLKNLEDSIAALKK